MASGTGDRIDELAALLGDVGHERGERASHGVDVGGHGGSPGDLRRLVARRAEDRARVVVHVDDGPEIDELDLLVGVHHVVGLEIAVGVALVVQVAEGRCDLDDVGDRLIGR